MACSRLSQRRESSSIRHCLRCGESILKYPDDEVEKALFAWASSNLLIKSVERRRQRTFGPRRQSLYKEVDLRNSAEKQCAEKQRNSETDFLRSHSKKRPLRLIQSPQRSPRATTAVAFAGYRPLACEPGVSIRFGSLLRESLTLP